MVYTLNYIIDMPEQTFVFSIPFDYANEPVASSLINTAEKNPEMNFFFTVQTTDIFEE